MRCCSGIKHDTAADAVQQCGQWRCAAYQISIVDSTLHPDVLVFSFHLLLMIFFDGSDKKSGREGERERERKRVTEEGTEGERVQGPGGRGSE